MTLFRLDASIRTEGSHSREIADAVEAEWRAVRGDEPVVRRHVGTEPVPAEAWGAAVSGSYVTDEQRSPEQRDALARAAREVDALASADAYLFATPLYNFGISQHLKAWIDLVITDPRMGPRAVPVTQGKPAVLVVVRGGSYAAGTPREGWDHATAYLLRILRDVWQLEVEVVEKEFTLVGVNPALDEFTELADQLAARATQDAGSRGRSLAGRAGRPVAA